MKLQDQLIKDIQEIFKIRKVKISAIGEHEEKDTIFIQISNTIFREKNDHAINRVSGSLIIFSDSLKMDFNYLQKCIQRASREQLKRFVFRRLEENRHAPNQSLVARSCEFTYFYKESYNPNKGLLTSIKEKLNIT